MDKPQDSGRPKGANFLLMGAGSMFTAMVISGFLVGYAIDELADTRPFGMLICGVLGMIGGMMKVHEVSTAADRYHARQQEKAEQQHREQADKA
jgi:ATP synthase protein I